MINLKLELFNFKKNLDYETQEDISRIVESHFDNVDKYSEKKVIQSLNEKLSIHTYDKGVKGLLENLNQDIQENELLYNLKDLYKVIEEKNQGMIYRQPLNILLDIINLEDPTDRMNKILNELALCDWVPEIRNFIVNLQSNPQKKHNMMSGGKCHDVFTVVESTEEGHIALIDGCWFLITEEKIEKTLLENHIEDSHHLNTLRQLQKALEFAEVKEDRIDFKLSENLVFGISTENDDTFINDDKLEKETTIEDIFSSPIVPIANKQFFPLIQTVSQNLDKIVELDIVKHLTNISNPFIECFVFNYGENMYLYRIDHRQGTSLFQYETATELINDVRNELGYDLSYFFEDKIDSETKKQKGLEDKIREIEIEMDEVNQNKEKVQANIDLLGESEVLSKALKILDNKTEELNESLKAAKELRLDLSSKHSS
jgi:hypothetical protein